MDVEEIAIASDWSGDSQLFVNTLVEIGLLDGESGGGLSLHDWTEHNPFAAGFEQRSVRARRASAARWGGESDVANSENDATRMRGDMRDASEEHREPDCETESTTHLNGDAQRNANSTAVRNAISTASSNAPSPLPSVPGPDAVTDAFPLPPTSRWGCGMDLIRGVPELIVSLSTKRL